MSYRIKPTHSFVLVKKLEDDKTEGGIVLPSARKGSATFRAEVIDQGPGEHAPDGKRWRPPCARGNTVLVLQGAGVEIDHEGQKLLMVHSREIVGVLLRGDAPEPPS